MALAMTKPFSKLIKPIYGFPGAPIKKGPSLIDPKITVTKFSDFGRAI